MTSEEMLLYRYLLGQLPEDEQAEVEDRAFAEPAYLKLIESVEADLIDTWVAGKLPFKDRPDFERLFFTSPSRIRKIQFARELAVVRSETEAVLPARRASFWKAWMWSPVAAAALAGIGTASWLAIQNNELRMEIAQARRVVAPAPEPQPAPLIASLLIAPGITRGETKAQQLLLPPTAQLVRIQIPVEERDQYPRYRIELRTQRGEEVLTLGATRRGPDVSFEVPAAMLAPGQYELALKGVSSGQMVDIGFYYIRVQKQNRAE